MKKLWVLLLITLLLFATAVIGIACDSNNNGQNSELYNNGENGEQDTSETESQVISWEDAGDYVGEFKTVEGRIVKTYYAKTSNGQPTFLNFHDPYEGYFTCVIWGDDRGNFPSNPETYYYGELVQVYGLIQTYKGDPEIILHSSSHIEIIESPTISD